MRDIFEPIDVRQRWVVESNGRISVLRGLVDWSYEIAPSGRIESRRKGIKKLVSDSDSAFAVCGLQTRILSTRRDRSSCSSICGGRCLQIVMRRRIGDGRPYRQSWSRRCCLSPRRSPRPEVPETRGDNQICATEEGIHQLLSSHARLIDRWRPCACRADSESRPFALPVLPKRTGKGSVALMSFASSTPLAGAPYASYTKRTVLTNSARLINEAAADMSRKRHWCTPHMRPHLSREPEYVRTTKPLQKPWRW